MLQTVSKRFFVTLPDFIGDALDRWADIERSKPATLAAFLLEKDIREAIERGQIPADSIVPTYKTVTEMVLREWDRLTAYGRIPLTRLEALKKGDRPTELENARLALALGLNEGYVEQLAEKKK